MVILTVSEIGMNFRPTDVQMIIRSGTCWYFDHYCGFYDVSLNN